jgi:hypothetical protein
MNGTIDHHVKKNKPDSEKHMWSVDLKKKKKRHEIRRTLWEEKEVQIRRTLWGRRPKEGNEVQI